MSETDNGKERYNVVEAAEILHTSTEAVRQRIRRGTLEATREAGRVFVLLREGQLDNSDAVQRPPESRNTPGSEAWDEVVEHLKDEIHFLRAKLDEAHDRDEVAAERDREMRQLIGALASQIRALPSPEGEPTEEAPPKREPWYVRLFG